MTTATACIVRPPLESEEGEWDRFVADHPHGSPFHLMAWKKTMARTFGYQPMYLLARDGAGIRGVLPLFFVRNFLLGKALISSPFAVYGGILADSDAVRKELWERARRMGEDLGVEYVELRNAYREQCVGEPNVFRYVTFTHDLAADEEAILAGLPKKTRNAVRKSLQQGFIMRRGVADPRVFDRMHARNMRRLGSPNFPLAYYRNLLANFGPMADIREVWQGERVMAVSLNLYFRGQMHTYHASADYRYNHLSPNTFMYFDHLRWAAANGYRTFDFGRSKIGTGAFDFKKHWNTTMRELPYQVVLVRRKELPNFSPANPRFQPAIRLWRMLPLFLTRALGARLISLFP